MTSQDEKRRETIFAVVLVAMVFFVFSFSYVPVPGVNEPHYLTKARAVWDADYGRHDFFLQSGNAHAVFFAAIGPLTTLMSFEAVAVAGRLLSLLLLAIGWSRVCQRLGLTHFFACLSAISFCAIALSGNFSGEWVIGGFESKVPSYGFALLAMGTWLSVSRGQKVSGFAACGAWTGLAIAVHPVVGMWFAIGICIAECLLVWEHRAHDHWFTKWLRCGIVYCATTILFSLPGLIPALRLTLMSEVEPVIQDRANRIQVFGRLSHHLDPASFPPSAWIHTGIILCLTATVWFIIRKPSSGRASPNEDVVSAQDRLGILLFVAVTIAAVGAVIGWHDEPYPRIDNWEFKARWLRFYPFRFVDALLPITCSLLVARLIQTRVPTALIPTRHVRLTLVLLVVVLTSILGRTAAERSPKAPSGYTAYKYWYWKDACRWIRDETQSDSVFLTPRESFGFKWFAERAEYVCFKDCPQDGPGILEWNQRLWRQFHWSRNSYRDDSTFDRGDLVKLKQDLGITHIITRRLGPFQDPPVYQNKVWRIYAVPNSDAQLILAQPVSFAGDD